MTAPTAYPTADRRRRPSAVAPAPERTVDAGATPSAIGERWRARPAKRRRIDATGVERLDSAGRAAVAALRPAPRPRFRPASPSTTIHRALVAAIEDVADDRPSRKREYGVSRGPGPPGLRGQRRLEGSARADRLLRRDAAEAGAHVQASRRASARPRRSPHGAGRPRRCAAGGAAVLPGRRGRGVPGLQHPARLRRHDLRRRTGQHRVPARVRRAADRDHPGRPHRQRVHRADRRDGEPRGGRRDPHARAWTRSTCW